MHFGACFSCYRYFCWRTIMSKRLEELKEEIKPLRDQLVNHGLYGKLNTINDLRVFMQCHVFAVWDFMSLLKTLQNALTCVAVPWKPVGNPNTRYLINEIVTGEESDVDEHGKRLSHFEMYLNAMKQAGATTEPIERLLGLLADNDITTALQLSSLAMPVSDFVANTFQTIATGKPHVQAAVFTFGREDLIPGMFISFVNELNNNNNNSVSSFLYYLERHIEVDGDHHSHMAYEMTEQLCGDNDAYWAEATDAVKQALQARINLWNHIERLVGVCAN